MDHPTPVPPVPLTRHALTYWHRHAGRLMASGVLQDDDLESFALLCMTWDKVVEISRSDPGADNFREMVQFTQLSKNYLSAARQFGLLPRERRHSKLSDATIDEEADEFGL